MIKYEELNLKPISTENKQGTDKIRDIHIQINKLLYFYAKKYADPKTAQDIIEDLTIYAKQLQDLPQNNKRDEIINKLRDIVKSLIQFKKSFKWSNNPNTIDAIQRTINYAVRNWVDLKNNYSKENNVYQKILELIIENSRIYTNILKPFIETYPEKYNDIKFDNFIILQGELFGKLQNQFSFYGTELHNTYENYLMAQKKIEEYKVDDLPF